MEAMKARLEERRHDGQEEKNEILLWTAHRLAILYADRGKLGEVEKMHMWVLEGRKKVLGAEHTSTLDSIHCLANLDKAQGKLARAEKMFMQALQGKKKALGAEHTSTLDTVNNLGLLYADRGKLNEAENMCMRALEGYKKALGPEVAATYGSSFNTVDNLGRKAVVDFPGEFHGFRYRPIGRNFV